MSSWDELLSSVGALNAVARHRIQAHFRREIEHQLDVQQMLRYGVCPCVVQGRYSTCCGTTLEPGEET